VIGSIKLDVLLLDVSSTQMLRATGCRNSSKVVQGCLQMIRVRFEP